MLRQVRSITRRFLFILLTTAILWSGLVLGPTSIVSNQKRARAISVCDKFAIDKGSILADNEFCACDGQDPTPVVTKVYVIGDSLTKAMRDTGSLQTKIEAKNFEVEKIQGNDGFNIADSLPLINADSAPIGDANTIVVALGTNPEPDFAQKVPEMINKIKEKAPDANILWMNVHVKAGAYIDPSFLGNNRVNQILNQKSEALGFTVIDWDSEVTENPDEYPFIPDGIHHTPEGYTAKSDFLANSIPEATASADPASPTAGGTVTEIAQQMLANSRITYWTNNGVNTRDQVVALSEGRKAYTTSSDLPRTEVDINVNILRFIAEVGQSNNIMVNALTDKDHSSTSNHYRGLAVDLDNNGGNTAPVSVLDPIAAKYGGTRNSETTHWHYDFTSGVDAAPPTAAAAVDPACCSVDSAQSSTDSTGAEDLQGFIDLYGQMAFDTGKKYGIPYEAILAQGSIESRNGNSELTKQGNNFFGIKAGDSWNGPVVTFDTNEQRPDGSVYTVTAAFRSYPNPQAGFDGYGEFITTNSRYANALNYPGNPVQYITEIKNAGYATDTQYVATLTRVIEQVTNYISSNNLFPPSSEVTPDAAPPNPGAAPAAAAEDCDQAPDPGDGSPEASKELARNLLQQRGLPDSEFVCLDILWGQRESGWKYNAINDAEGNNDTNDNGVLDLDAGEDISETEGDAYGIPQSLPGGKMATKGPDWKSNPLTQINWGLEYIEGRYQTPCGAKAHSDSVGWY
jgi:flagellum-specific peptidoglycan hydrolase FlgJ/lysophospholipase L1-like esterase